MSAGCWVMTDDLGCSSIHAAPSADVRSRSSAERAVILFPSATLTTASSPVGHPWVRRVTLRLIQTHDEQTVASQQSPAGDSRWSSPTAMMKPPAVFMSMRLVRARSKPTAL
eukprot:1717675-Alexandrium_andersonii.AAC.1